MNTLKTSKYKETSKQQEKHKLEHAKIQTENA